MGNTRRWDLKRLAGNFAVVAVFFTLAACGGGNGGGTVTTSNAGPNANAQATGSTLYKQHCEQCHQPLASSTKLNKTAAEIQAAIAANTGGMGRLSTLHANEVVAIADALKTTATYQSFDSINSKTFQFNGAAVLDGSSIRLTPNQQYTTGSAFLVNPFTLGSNFGFNAYFNFTLGAGGRSARHADGFTFTLQTLSNKAGASGGNLGFGGINPSLGVEFDTYHNPVNNDPNDNHVAFVTNGILTHDPSAPVIPPVLMYDGGTYHVWVDYNGTTMEVRMNTKVDRSTAVLLLSKAIDLKSVMASRYVTPEI